MQILVVDESEKKAWRKSRRILGATLYRRGSRTFTGRLSAEGLSDLVATLKRNASKNTAIAVFKLTSHAEFELITRIGRTSAWGDEGWFANRTITRQHTPSDGFSACEKLLRILARLAALFHDLGKGNDQFQQMLRGKDKAQHARHELVSLLMLDAARSAFPDIFTALASDPLPVFEQVRQSLPSTLAATTGFTGPGTESLALDLLTEMLSSTDAGLFSCIRYMVLTHHRPLDAARQSMESQEAYTARLRLLDSSSHTLPSFQRQLNTLGSGTQNPVTLKADNFTLSRDGQPWENTSWVSAVQANAAALKRLLSDNPDLLGMIARQPANWAMNIAYVTRPSLILADHLASALKEAYPGSSGELVYANTVEVRGRAAMADTLPVHLLKTRYALDPFFKGLSGKHKALPAWRPAKSSMLYNQSGPEKFRWQNEASDMVRAVPNIADRPFMALVVSSTGAGKTIGAVKLLAAASGDTLRYTCALGLRSLTLQTGIAYREQLGLTESECMTVVGDALYARLATPDSTALTPEAMGSESLEEDTPLVLDGEAAGTMLASALEFDTKQAKGLGSSKVLAMSEVPVLACTVDHLMGASTLTSGTDTRMALRLATADLILDEIDNYGLEDLQALCRLAYAAGVYGRRLVLMSATVSETVLQGLYDAWRAGLQCWQLRTGRHEAPVVALGSNQVPSRVLPADGELSVQLPDFVASLVTELGRLPPKTKAKKIAPGATLQETFQRMLEEAIAMARVHHTKDPVTGGLLSAGFVRFNKVAHCRKFAKFLMNDAVLPADVSLKVQCYHRRMPLFHLAHIEKTLNDLWRRDDAHRIFSHPLIASWITDAPLRLVIVSTTSIQETGRDHDYDFAITEPWSTRSLIQLAGRVRRHRPAGPVEPNIGVLDTELSRIEGSARAGGLEVGFESVFMPRLRKTMALSSMIEERDAQFSLRWQGLTKQRPCQFEPLAKSPGRVAWLPESFFEHGIDARACLSTIAGSDAPLPYLEHFAQERRMKRPHNAATEDVGDTQHLFSAQDTIPAARGIPELLWGRHSHVIRFRRQAGAQALFTLDPSQDYKALSLVQRHPATGAIQLRPRDVLAGPRWTGGTTIHNLDRVLIRTDLLDSTDVAKVLNSPAPGSATALLSHTFEAYVPESELFTKQVYFDPLLGGDTQSATLH